MCLNEGSKPKLGLLATSPQCNVLVNTIMEPLCGHYETMTSGHFVATEVRIISPLKSWYLHILRVPLYYNDVVGPTTDKETCLFILVSKEASKPTSIVPFSLFQSLFFSVSGIRLVHRIRLATFKSILGQEVSWFDSKKNTPALLTSRLANDARLISGVS